MASLDNRSADRFATTRWSVVMRHANMPAGDARDALGELARRYWYPVYVYMRRCGHAPAAAGQLAQRFLQRLLEAGAGGNAQPNPGPYRGYLLARLYEFLADDAHGAIGAAGTTPVELETRYQQDQLGLLSPEQSFQRAFALQLLNRTMRRLRSEASQTGHGDMFEQLEPFLAREAAPGEYEFIAVRLHTRPLTIVVALKRLRQRFRELAAEELVDTVSSAADLATEQDALLAVLGGAAP